MELKLLIFAVICVCQVIVVNGANILAILPLDFASHSKAYRPIFEEIVRRGDNLTLISGYPLSSQFQSSYKFVNVAKYNKFDGEKIIPLMLKLNQLDNLFFCYNAVSVTTEAILSSAEIQDFIRSTQTFDLVMAELFCNDAFFALGPKFNAPVISLTSQALSSTHNWILRNPFPPSYVPNSFLPLTDRMTLFSRLVNTGFNFMSVLHYEWISLPRFQNMIEKYFHFKEGNVPHIKDILNNISASFVNAHHSLGYPKPNLPNVVNLAGIHMTPLKPLPKTIQNFIDGAQHGIIYVSLGSILPPRVVSHLGVTIVDILSKFPQRVILKWEKDLLQDIPDNMLVDKWLPQADILYHPNCRLFITHGGLLGLLESLNASVPVLSIPFFGDQFHNAAMIEYFEIGLTLDVENVQKELPVKVSQILNNDKYQRNMKQRSTVFRERLNSPLETAMFWIDHVIKHPDSSHLRSGAVHLTWFELYSLDVLAVVGVVIFSVAFILKFIILCIKESIWSKNIEKTKILKQD